METNIALHHPESERLFKNGFRLALFTILYNIAEGFIFLCTLGTKMKV